MNRPSTVEWLIIITVVALMFAMLYPTLEKML